MSLKIAHNHGKHNNQGELGLNKAAGIYLPSCSDGRLKSLEMIKSCNSQLGGSNEFSLSLHDESVFKSHRQSIVMRQV